MKKLFSKIAVLSLMSTVFFMASGLCINSLLNFKIETQIVKAASINNDSCTDEQPSEATSAPVTPSHHNSILPCCVGETHPSVITVSQSSEMNKFIPIVFYSENQILKNIPQGRIYAAPIFSPPELISLKTTILRI